jgi:N-acetylglucosamine-6-phosphate deacetylase
LYIIKDVNIVSKDEVLKGYDIKFNHRIIDIQKEIETPKKYNVIDGKDMYLTPGFVDIHMHGSFGIDIMEAKPSELEEMSKGLLKEGTTSILPTVMTATQKRMETATNNIKEVMKSGNNVFQGINLEGPLLNPKKAGAQDKRYMKALNLELFEKYKDIIEIVTVAPEVEGATALINKLNQLDIVSSMGHTDATYEESIKGFENGISLVTHLFNGMRGIHHREIGAAGAALLSDVSTELIADGIHISKPMIKLILRLKDIDQIILITDAQPAALYEGDEITFNDKKVILEDGSARYEDGTLAGSVLSMQQAVKNMSRYTDLKLFEIIRLATYNPAQKIGMASEIGLIDIDQKADLLLLNKNLDVKEVFKEGQKVK